LDRLKDKVGTRSLPTAEMTLTGARGWLLGDEGSGLSNLVRIVLTTSRFWNAMAAAGTLRAAQRIGLAYSEFREAFGQPIAAFPLVAESLDNLDRDARNYTAAAFAVLAAWEQVATKERAGETPDAVAAMRLRILVMLAKACATRRANERIHETIMLLGGNGIEERFSALPRLWRDSIIYETWEGPHGLLLSRSLADAQKFGAAEDPLRFTRQLMGVADPRELGLGAAGAAAEQDIVGLGARLESLLSEDSERAQMVAFERWATDFYDAFGALQAALVAAGSPR
jgi:hypothetical protein